MISLTRRHQSPKALLGLLGVGGIYHDGNQAAGYKTKLQGIRVLFADMVLAEHGADQANPVKCAEFTC